MEDPFGLWFSFVSAPMPSRPELATLSDLRLDLPTMDLREAPARRGAGSLPVLIIGPFALHDSSIADFAPGHSIAAVLVQAGFGPVALTYWKSATHEMRGFGVDRYFSDLNVAVDDLGGRVALVGLCQGGWLAAAFAARFPQKVQALVLAGAPLDLVAAPSQITQSLAKIPAALLSQMVRTGGGRLLGRVALPLWSSHFNHPFDASEVLQVEGPPDLLERARAWHEWTVDLPGAYFLDVSEWLFRENRLVSGTFPVLGRSCGLSGIKAPTFLLCAEEDEIVPPGQSLALQKFISGYLRIRSLPGRHLALFMGAASLATGWREAAQWLKGQMGRKSTSRGA